VKNINAILVAAMALLALWGRPAAAQCQTGNVTFVKGDVRIEVYVTSKVQFLSSCNLRTTSPIVVRHPASWTLDEVRERDGVAQNLGQSFFVRFRSSGSVKRHITVSMSGVSGGFAWLLSNDNTTNTVLFAPVGSSVAPLADGPVHEVDRNLDALEEEELVRLASRPREADGR